MAVLHYFKLDKSNDQEDEVYYGREIFS